MKKIYLQPYIEFEEIEGADNLLDKLSQFKTEGSGTTNDNTPEELPWGGDATGGGTGDEDPNG